MTNLDEKKKIMKLKKKPLKKLTKMDEERIDELNGKIKKKLEDENAKKNEKIGLKNDGGEEAEKKMKEVGEFESMKKKGK